MASALLLAGVGHAQEGTVPVSFSVGDDGCTRIEVPSAADLYHVLYYRAAADDATTERAVAIHMGAAGSVVLTEPLRANTGGAYRVATFRRDAPGDADGDGVDDLAELAREEKTKRAPLNRRAPFDRGAGAVAIPDMATYRELSYAGRQHLVRSTVWDHTSMEHVKFVVEIDETDPPQVYYQNTNTYLKHTPFILALGLPGSPIGKRYMRGQIVHERYLRGPSGDVGVFRYEYQPNDWFPLSRLAKTHELIAASMPFLRNNLVFYVRPEHEDKYRRDKAKFDASRVPVMLTDDLYGNLLFDVLNPALGYGLLGVFDPGERPTFRDVAILRRLPNDLTTAAGFISLVPQTPLSHVNLRAVQNGVPNVYIGDALEDATISALIGKYVRLEVRAAFPQSPDGSLPEDFRSAYSIREATAEEVEAHHAARRPTESQTPARDLTVTAYKDLDDIAFADADAFGVKAANVAAMRDFGLPAGTVPDGYALPFYFYDEFMKHNDFYTDVDALLADTDFQADIATREAELKKLRRRIKNGAVPDWMDTRLETLRGLFPAGTSIRCRSSTNNEDLPDFSGAGLYDSYTHHPTEGRLSKSIKQVYASMWNLRAFEEREFHRIDHKAAAMGVLLHPNYSGELANGVAVSGDLVYGSEAGAYYVNAQVGEDLVTNPSALAVPEELLLTTGEDFETTVLRYSNLVEDGARVLSDAHITELHTALGTIHDRFHTLYSPGTDEDFAMEIEFKITAENSFAVKQARPWVGPLKPLVLPAAPGGFEAFSWLGNVNLVWHDAHDPKVLGYRVRVRKTTETAWQPWEQLPDDATTSYQLRGLTLGVLYHIQLAAFSPIGQGPASEVSITPKQ